jgi:hypothetical protein
MSYVNPYYKTAHWHALQDACRRRAHGRCEVPGCQQLGRVADHIETRPPVPYPCEQDRLDNLRWICRSHDAQVKEQRRGGARKAGGKFRVKGSDAQGWPLDPARR